MREMMFDKRNAAISSMSSDISRGTAGGKEKPLSGQEQRLGPAEELQKDLSEYSEEKIYLPAFATQQAMCGQYEYARQLYDCWIKAKCEPDDYRVFFNRAICNYELEDYEQALSDVNVAIKLKDEWPKGHYVKGKILSEMKKFEAAEESFLKSLKLDRFENADTEARIRKNIFMALLNDGFDAAQADHASAKQAAYEDAKEYLLSGAYDQSLEMARCQKASKMSELNRKVGRLLPPVWFTKPYRHRVLSY